MNGKYKKHLNLWEELNRRIAFRIIIIYLPVMLMSLEVAVSQANFAIRQVKQINYTNYSIQPGCDGCSRRYIIENISSDAGEMNEQSIKHHLNSTVITPCFHALSSGEEVPREFKPMMNPRAHEYYFLVSYEEGMKGEIKSRLQIDLFFNGSPEEHVRTWTTETGNPNAKYTWHKNSMFMNDGAVLRKFYPMELAVLNDFEKRPYSCEIKPEKETLNPGETIEVEITNIQDIEGVNSREFNRLIVQSPDGEILGGTPLTADNDLKAFRVGDGTVKFRYKAPQSCVEPGNTIIVYNSCDILNEDLWPLAISEMKDKIAEKKIRLMCADWTGTVSFTYSTSSKDTEADPGVLITTQEDITSQGSASLDLYYNKELNDYEQLGAPAGNYIHNYTRTLSVSSGDATARTKETCRCSGGFTDEGPDERSFLDIRGNEYSLQITLTTDPDSDCQGITEEYIDGELVNTYGFVNHFSFSDYVEGFTDGKIIEGSKNDFGEGWSSKITWSLRRNE